MNSSIRRDFHSNIASLLLNDIQYLKSTYYYFIGKVETWGSSDIVPNGDVDSSQYQDSLIRNNTLFFKKISQNDVTLACPRYDWATGTVIPQWDHTIPLDGIGYYVMTDENNVYVCLDNNALAVSTQKPTGTSFYPFRTSDGYLWKFMYTIPSFKRRRFISINYIPVQKAITDSFYSKGSIDEVTITNPGSGYSDALLTTITVTGATVGSGATGTITVNGSGQITAVTVTNGGSGYTKGVRVSVTTSSGVGAVLTPVITSGVVTSVTITSAGVGYTGANSLVFSVGGFTAIPILSRQTGSIVDTLITNAGIGYAVAPTLTVHTPSTGTGAYTGHSTALLEAIIDNGSVQRILIRDPGINYPSDTATSIVVQGDGTGAVFSPIIVNGELIDVVIENPGSGYTSAILTVVGNGTGAKLVPVVGSSDFTSTQSVIEQTTVPGAIYSMLVRSGGVDYTNQATLSITGDGTGATGTLTISNGVITKINVTNFGSGYTYANLTVVDPARSDPLNNKPKLDAYAVLPPLNGHGYDAVSELGGNTIAFSSSIRVNQELNLFNQDYRQYGIVKDPRSLLTGKFYTSDNDINVYSVKFDTVSGLLLDEILTGNNITFRVIYINGNTVYLQPLTSKLISPIGQLSASGSRVYTCSQTYTTPIVDKYSGTLLYVSNENPFSFTENQGILIKTYLKF